MDIPIFSKYEYVINGHSHIKHVLNELYIEEEARLGSNFYLDNLTCVKWAVV